MHFSNLTFIRSLVTYLMSLFKYFRPLVYLLFLVLNFLLRVVKYVLVS